MPVKREVIDDDVLRDHFTQNEMCALWDRLKRARGREDMSVEEAWKAIVKLKTGTVAKSKGSILMDMVCYPGTKWAQSLLKMHESLRSYGRKETLLEEKTEGQLVQEHGYVEAMRFIASGKYVEKLDEDGGRVFVRRSKNVISGREHEAAVNLERLAEMSADSWVFKKVCTPKTFKTKPHHLKTFHT